MKLVLDKLEVGHKHPLTEAITTSFGAGGMHVVLGANGAGKTTLLRTVLGVQAPLAGRITLDEGE